MPKGENLIIDIVAADIMECKKFFGTIVYSIIRKNNIIHDNEVIVSMAEKGKELLFDAERYEESVTASRRADNYVPGASVSSLEDVSDTMELSFRCRDTFCGRVLFRCFQSEGYEQSELTDAVLFIVDRDRTPFDNISINLLTSFTAAVYTETEECDALKEFNEYMSGEFPAEHDKLFCFGYNPLGFADGKVNSEDDAEPYGTEEIFWNVVRNAAQNGQEFYNRALRNALKTVSRRRSVFQRKSFLRQLDADLARESYVTSVSSLYGIENLILLLNGELK